MPERIQLRRTAGWRKPEGAIEKCTCGPGCGCEVEWRVPMFDPVISARARALSHVGNGLPNVSVGWLAEVGAGEALRPIRDLHRPTGTGTECVVCFDSEGHGQPWPCDTARLIYTDEELSDA